MDTIPDVGCSSEAMLNADFTNRWLDIRRSDVLMAVDQGIQGMSQIAEKSIKKHGHKRVCALADLEWLALSTARKIPQILAFDPQKCIYPPLKVGPILAVATAQYLVHYTPTTKWAILRGAKLANGSLINCVHISDLSVKEAEYVIWVIPRILHHLIYLAHSWTMQDIRRFMIVESIPTI